MLQDTYNIEIVKMRDEVEELRAKVIYLENLISPPSIPRLSYKLELTVKEAEILGLLIKRGGTVVTRQMIYYAIYGDDQRDTKIIDVFLVKIRKKLDKISIPRSSLITFWGRGWVLQDPGLTMLREMEQGA